MYVPAANFADVGNVVMVTGICPDCGAVTAFANARADVRVSSKTGVFPNAALAE